MRLQNSMIIARTNYLKQLVALWKFYLDESVTS